MSTVIHSLDDVPHAVQGCVLTIGNFDGVHLGHQKILRIGKELALGDHVALVAMTFEPPPDLVLRPQDPPKRLTPIERKVELLGEAGADFVVVAPSTKELLGLEPDAFLQDVIQGRFAPWYVVEGPNFFFGRKRAGTIETLEEYGRAKCFQVRQIETLMMEVAGETQRVCSTLIRALVAEGNVEEAARCLSRPYTLYGTVIAGEGRGRFLDFPTANIPVSEQIVPANGIYAGWAEIGGERHVAAISIGTKPTFHESDDVHIEAFILDADGPDFYDQPMALEVLHHLRPQERFDNAEALMAQITKDVQRVRELIQPDRV
jgi:riboflavin kinase / FMN adenylyltransferase